MKIILYYLSQLILFFLFIKKWMKSGKYCGKAKLVPRRGIGASIRGLTKIRRVMDLVSESNLEHRLEAVLIHHNTSQEKVWGKKIFEKIN